MELLVVICLVVFAVTAKRQNDRLKRLETEVDALRRDAAQALPQTVVATDASVTAATPAPAPAEVPGATEAPVEQASTAGPWSAKTAPSIEEAGVAAAAATAEPAARARPDIETALGTRWAVWVGGLALALGGVFLVRYSIESGFFGPGLRLSAAVLFALLLAAGGEFVRRRGFDAPIGGVKGAYVPAILTAAASFTLFGAIYAAHGIYGFIGPATAFVLLGIVGLATLAAALMHGQALAGLGLLGAYLTPILVASDAPSPWTLFLYLSVVLVSAVAVASVRSWRFLATGAYAGAGIWTFLYLAGAADHALAAVLVLHLAGFAILGLSWLTRSGTSTLRDPTPWTAGAFGALFAILLGVAQDFAGSGGAPVAAALVAAMLAVAAWRGRGTPLLHTAGFAAVMLAAARLATSDVAIDLGASGVTLDTGFLPPPSQAFSAYAAGLAVLFLAAGTALAWRLQRVDGRRAASWGFWAAVVPVATLAASWALSGNLNVDLPHALAAVALAAILAASGELLARAEDPPLQGRLPVSMLLAGSAAALALGLAMGLTPFWTTVLTGLAAALSAWLTRLRHYPVLGWLAAGFALVTFARITMDPTIVGAESLGRTPIFNALLPAYLLPAIAFIYAAWQLARTTGGKARLMMEAFAAVFALLGIAMLVRHAMNGGVIDGSEPSLAEQAIYSLLAIGAGGILLFLDRRSPSSVLRWGSIAAGVVSTLSIVSAHFGALNPLFTNESTGTIPVANLILLAYLLPAVAMAALAWYARGRRPAWYVAMLAATAAALAFAYATLSVRRIFQGEFIGVWKGMDGLETYTYSAVWLALGVAILVAGLRFDSRTLRLGSAVLVVLAVAKAFLFDMSELEGVLRALSFIGLGAVLIGIGLFYQRMLASSSAR